VSAVEAAARERGYYAAVARVGPASADAGPAIEELLGQDVEGVVIVAPRAAALPGLASLLGSVPAVALHADPGEACGIPVAQAEQDRGTRMMMRYLIGQGHRRILHVAGTQDWHDGRSRLAAYESELRSAGLPVLPPAFGDWTADSGYAAGHALIRDRAAGDGTGLGFTAVFAANDQIALGLIHAFREVGLDVPGDVSVAGHDDDPGAAHFWPPLTTVRQDFSELGRSCVDLLIDAVRTTPGPGAPAPVAARAVVSPQLIVRNSVASASPPRPPAPAVSTH
jgi:DNA-binding LacI/PurR family transcriptional regulator